MRLKKILLASILATVLVVAACVVPSWVNTVEADAKIMVPIAGSLIDVIDPALAPLVTLIQNGFTALLATLDQYKASPTDTNLQAVEAAFQAVNDNVDQLENAAQIKNAHTKDTIKEVVVLLDQAVIEIAAEIPQPVQAQMKITRHGAVRHWKAKDFKEQYNRVIQGDSRFKPLN